MYDFLKLLQDAVERIGDIHEVRVTQKGPYTEDEVRFEGTATDGRPFTLKLLLREERHDS